MTNLEEIRLSELDESHPEIMETAAGAIRAFAGAYPGFRDVDQHGRYAAAHSVFLTLINMSREQRDGIENPRAYIAAAIKKALSKQWQTQKETPEHLDSSDIPDLADPRDGADTIGRRVLLSEIWDRLDEDDRKLLYLIIFGYTSEEMAKILNIPSTAARQRVARLRARLRDEFRQG
jgi:RNA polymerase sigma factor (sigma-70 family)